MDRKEIGKRAFPGNYFTFLLLSILLYTSSICIIYIFTYKFISFKYYIFIFVQIITFYFLLLYFNIRVIQFDQKIINKKYFIYYYNINVFKDILLKVLQNLKNEDYIVDFNVETWYPQAQILSLRLNTNDSINLYVREKGSNVILYHDNMSIKNTNLMNGILSRLNQNISIGNERGKNYQLIRRMNDSIYAILFIIIFGYSLAFFTYLLLDKEFGLFLLIMFTLLWYFPFLLIFIFPSFLKGHSTPAFDIQK